MNYHFNSVEFIAAWSDWLEYKKVQHRFKYKSEKYEQRAINRLILLSENDEEKAIELINNAIDCGWKGIYPLINKDAVKKTGTSTDRIEALKKW